MLELILEIMKFTIQNSGNYDIYDNKYIIFIISDSIFKIFVSPQTF